MATSTGGCGGIVPPNQCLICYSKLHHKQLTHRKNLINDKSQQGLEEVAKDVVFVLRIILNIPEQLLQRFLEETGTGPGGWISVCDECLVIVAEGQAIYRKIFELTGKFKVKARKLIEEKMKTSEEKRKDKQQVPRMMVSDTCRKFVNERSYFQAVVGEDPFTVEDITALTKSLLSKLSGPVNQRQVILLINPGATTAPEFLQVNQIQNQVPTPTATLTVQPPVSVLNVSAAPHITTTVTEEDPLSILPDDSEDASDNRDIDSDNDDECKEEIKSEGPDESDLEEPCEVPGGSITSAGDDDDTNDSEYKPDIDNDPNERDEDDANDPEVDDEGVETPTLLPVNGKFECSICKRKFKSYCGLSRHLVQGHKIEFEKSWTCSEPTCGKTFNNYCLFQKHIAYHKKGKSEYKCEFCDQAFPYFSQRASHLLSEHGVTSNTRKNRKDLPSSSLTAQCPVCQSQHSNARSLRTHIRYHHKGHKIYIESDKYPCTWENCSKVFSTPVILKVHMSRHEGKPMFKCDLCEEHFYSIQERYRHKDAKHSGIEFKCEICSKMFQTNQYLQGHYTAIHGVERKRKHMVDPEKKKKVTSETIEVKRVRKPRRKTQTDAKPKKKAIKTPKKPEKIIEEKKDLGSGASSTMEPFQCHLCGKQMSRKEALRRHMIVFHEEKQFKCDICGKEFALKYKLKCHQNEIHGIGEAPKKFQCDVVGCRLVFLRQESLELHKKKEHGETGNEKYFQCSVCGKDFHKNFKLKQHEMLHFNQETRPFKCDLCGKGFANNHNLRYHQLKTHKAERLIERRKETKPRNYVGPKNGVDLKKKC